MIRIEVPMSLPSLANSRGHTKAKGRIVKTQRYVVGMSLCTCGSSPSHGPVTIRLTRIAPRRLDGDNLQTSLKPTRDAVAQWLGYRDDDHPNLRWMYAQQKAPRARYQAALIEIYEGHHDCVTCGSALAEPQEKAS